MTKTIEQYDDEFMALAAEWGNAVNATNIAYNKRFKALVEELQTCSAPNGLKIAVINRAVDHFGNTVDEDYDKE